MRAEIKPIKIAPASPAPAASVPPVIAPSNPFSLAPLIAPLARLLPKPVIGIVIPACTTSLTPIQAFGC